MPQRRGLAPARERGAREDALLPLHLFAFLERFWRRGVDELVRDLESGDHIAQLHALRNLGALSGRRLRLLEPSLLGLFAGADDAVKEEGRQVLRGLYSEQVMRRRAADGGPEERAAAVRMVGALREDYTIPLLFEQGASADQAVRDAAVAELVGIGDEAVVCGAIEALQKTHGAVHGAAVAVLRGMGEAATSLLAQALEAPQREVRFGAIKALEMMRASQACPQLIPLLSDPVEEIRAQTARVLAGMRYRDALPHLVRALNDPAQAVRIEAATALAALGEAEAVQGLLNFLRRCAEDLSFEVADQDFLAAIAAMPDLPAAGYLMALEGQNQSFAVSIALALEDAGTVNRWLLSLPEAHSADERRTLTALLQAVARLGVREPFMEGLALPDPELRGVSAWLLGACQHAEAVPALIGLLADTSAQVRRRAIEALGAIKDPACAKALSDALGDPDREARAAAAAALAEMIETGAISPPAHSSEIMLAQDAERHQLPGAQMPALPGAGASSYSLPARVTDVLGSFARAAGGAQLAGDRMLSGAAALVRALHDPAENVRVQVSEALGRLGIDSAAYELLDRALNDNSPQVRAAAARSLGRVNASEAAPALLRALQHHDPDVRRRAAEAIGELGDHLAGPALIQALEDPSPPVRQKAARSLWQIADAALVESLREHLHHPDPKVRAAVTGCLGRLRATEAMEAIAGRLEDPNRYVRASAVNALGNIGQEARSLQRRVAALLADNDPFVRLRAAETLARTGEPDEEVVRMLLRMCDEPAEDVRRTARATLLELANGGMVGAMVQALRDEAHRDHVRSILLETNLVVMRSLLTTARQADADLGGLLLEIISDVLKQRGSIEDCRRDLMSLDPTQRLAGLETLALLRTSEAIDLIAGALFNDPLPALRDKAAHILAEIDDPTATAMLRRAGGSL